MEDIGIDCLNDRGIEIKRKNESIYLYGLRNSGEINSEPYSVESSLSTLATKTKKNNKNFNILLSHDPIYLDDYSNEKFDLVFSGHRHGGQFRLPLIGPIIAPGEGLFPKMDKGIFNKGETMLVLSAGIGSTIIPFRLHNKAEIVVTVLKK